MLKASGLLLAGVIVLAIVVQLVKPVLTLPTQMGGYGVSEDVAHSEPMMGEMGMRLSLDNIGVPAPTPGTVGVGAEDYEVTDYSVSYETRNKDVTCGVVSRLKALDYVVFESANEHDRGCTYTFKVTHAHVDDILATLTALDPKELNENTYTIKRQLDDFTSEAEILKRKLASIDDTLESALDAYDEITALATRTQNAEALARIFDSKIGIIERLTQERLNTAAQLERLERSKAEQLDRLEYTYFYVSVYERAYVDGESLKDSWKAAVRGFVEDVNRVVQDVTINLLAFLFFLAQYLLYLFILLVVAKYAWKVATHVWRT